MAVMLDLLQLAGVLAGVLLALFLALVVTDWVLRQDE